jgi:SAM-dependent methyltransferase
MNSEKNYPSVVASTGQVNTPPGSYETVKEWINHAFIDFSSNVLEVGCSNGFISHQINGYTRAKVTGLDLSSESIEKAKGQNSKTMGCSFQVGNAGNLNFRDEAFTHVIIGGHLPWVSGEQRKTHIREALRVLKQGGFLLTAVYYFSSPPSENFVKEFNAEFGTRLKPEENYAFWSSLFDFPELDLEYESNFRIQPPSEKRKEEYLSFFSPENRTIWSRKVDLFAKNGEYLSFFIKIFRKSGSSEYRQNPRGGIYCWEKVNEKVY